MQGGKEDCWGGEQAGRMGLTKEGMELDWNVRKREDCVGRRSRTFRAMGAALAECIWVLRSST